MSIDTNIWDINEIRGRLGGQEVLVKQVAQLFLDDSAPALESLQTEADPEVLYKLAHKLKGSSADISANVFSESAKQLELAATERNMDRIPPLKLEVMQNFEVLKELLVQYLNAS